MKTGRQFATVVVALLGVGLLHAGQQAPVPAASTTTDTFNMPLPGYDGPPLQATWLDASGHPMSAGAFRKAMHEGRRFDMRADTAAGKITLQLRPQVPVHGEGETDPSALAPTLAPGHPLPEFRLPVTDGTTVDSNQFRGKPILVDLLFADCAGCIEELPALGEYASHHPEMQFLAITFDQKNIAQSFVNKWGLQWPLAYDGQQVIDQIGARAFPTLLLFGADGRLRATRTGSVPADTAASEKTGMSSQQARRQWLERWVKNGLATP